VGVGACELLDRVGTGALFLGEEAILELTSLLFRAGVFLVGVDVVFWEIELF
jgi:hypothetical protein